jgi:hypothetical protein
VPIALRKSRTRPKRQPKQSQCDKTSIRRSFYEWLSNPPAGIFMQRLAEDCQLWVLRKRMWVSEIPVFINLLEHLFFFRQQNRE